LVEDFEGNWSIVTYEQFIKEVNYTENTDKIQDAE
jgi:hypothetical protein